MAGASVRGMNRANTCEVFQPGSRVESINQACGYTKIRKETSFLRGRSSCAKKSPVKAGLGRTGNQPIIFLEPPL